jgi:hypothetical protein
MTTGTAVLDFGSTPTDTASVVVTGQAGIVAGLFVEAFFMRETTADNGVDEHEEAATVCRLVCGSIVAGTGFTIYAHVIGALAIKTFNVKWVWS